jgi:transcriptional regulator with XRE-family HTH domain
LERLNILTGHKVALTQAQVAERMGTTQSAVSRAESGLVDPSSGFIDRFAIAVGKPIVLTFGAEHEPSRRTLRARVRRGMGDIEFDPYDRHPSAAEIRTLEADGLGRDTARNGGGDKPRGTE